MRSRGSPGLVNYHLPRYIAEELSLLQKEEFNIVRAWTDRKQAITEFRRDILPHSDRDDDAFRIVIPVSGGLDSATCHEMALRAGLPVEAVVLNTGTKYFQHDRIAADHLTNGRLTVLTLPSIATEMVGDFQLGRNSLIVWTILEWIKSRGWWGELWFGNLGANYLETPIIGGDKSFRWLLAMQQLATATGQDVRLSSPLIGMTKADLVSWWSARGNLEKALTARSCFADQPGHCGRCWACFYRYVAFAARGARTEVMRTYKSGIDFSDSVTEVRSRLKWQTVTARTERTAELEGVLAELEVGG